MPHQEKDYFSKIAEYGQLIVISGPRGAGKRTILAEYLKQHPNAVHPPTVTTRPKRDGEVEGERHFFVTGEEFEQMIRAHQILDYTYYRGYGYGTTRYAMEENRRQGRNVILIEDSIGAMRVKAQCPDCTMIFLLTPEWEDTEERLRERWKNDPEELENRLTEAQEDILCADQFDYILINDTVENTVRRLGQIIHGLRYSKNSMKHFIESYIASEITSELVDEVRRMNKRF